MSNACTPLDNLLGLQRAGFISAVDFMRMAAELTKTNATRLAEAEDADDERASQGSEQLVDEDGMLFGQGGGSVSSEPAGSFDNEYDEDMRDGENQEEEPILESFSPGDVLVHTSKGTVTVVRVGEELDYYNKDRVYVRGSRLKIGAKRKTESFDFWASRDDLTRPEVTGTDAEVTGTDAEALVRETQAQEPQVAGLPASAALERKRKLSEKASAQTRRHAGTYKTAESKVWLETRLQQFPNDTLIITKGPDGMKLWCRACKDTVFNKHSSIADHCRRHKAAVAAFLARKDDDAALKEDLFEYYRINPDERQGSVDPDAMVFRYRTVETFLASGTPLSVCDIFRPLLERAGFALTDSSNLTFYIPQIESKQIQLVKTALEGQYLSIQFDGTTRLGEAINVVAKWCSSDFKLVKRLLDFHTLEKHVDAPGLCSHINDLLGRKRGVPPMNVIGFSRDSVSTNGAACRRLKLIYTAAVDMLCICHTLCHVGEHFHLPTLGAFMTPWLELVGGRNPHAGAKMLWKETVAPATVPGYSHVRWYAKAEIIFVIAEAGTRRLRDFLLELEQRNYGEATRINMQRIYDNQGDMLRLEIAGMLDMRKLVSTTYELEGDRLEILLIYDRVEALRAVGNSLRTRADGMLPNVDAILRRLMDLKPGVKIEKYFDGHGVCVGTLKKKEKVDSTLYPGEEREAWLVSYADNTEEHFEEDELRSGKDGPAPTGHDGKPVLIVRDLQKHKDMYDAFVPGFDYLESRITGTCDAQYSCVQMYEVARVVRVFNPNFAANHINPAFVDSMAAITPLQSYDMITKLKQELPLYVVASQGAPTIDTSDVESFTIAILDWWRTNGKSFPTWALAARIAFGLSPNSAACERVFSLVKHMFGEQQMSVLADYIRAALMLKYNQSIVG